jgi:hypothetical protein
MARRWLPLVIETKAGGDVGAARIYDEQIR